LNDCVIVRGWVFADEAGIESVTIRINGVEQAARYGQPRDDVAVAYPTHPNARHSGFSAYFSEVNTRRINRLEVVARSRDGRTMRLFDRSLAAANESRGAMALLVRAAAVVLRHPQTLLSAPSWQQAWRQLRGTPAIISPVGEFKPIVDTDAQEQIRRASESALESFLAANARLRVPAVDTPLVSIVVVVWNQPALTLSCLRALASQDGVPFEVIVVDNASIAETAELLDRGDGIVVIRNAVNVGFTVAANQGAARACGKYLLFVNSDAELQPGTVDALVRTCERDRMVGAVGGKLVFPDGRLQEAGSTIWADGSCQAYGRNGDPTSFVYTFVRDVDFCSAALLLTPRALFEELRGFDERYRPAYYEDADYCVRVWKSGRRVVYQPAAVALHLEFGSGSQSDAVRLQDARRQVFVATHQDWLAGQLAASASEWAARHHPHQRKRVLVIDDALPRPALGAGFPRAAALLRGLVSLGYAVTVYPTAGGSDASAHPNGFEDVEVVSDGLAGLSRYLRSERRFDVIIVSRPHNMQYVKAALGRRFGDLSSPVVYDAEAIFAERDAARAALNGQPYSIEETAEEVKREVQLGAGCVAILTVTDFDRRRFEAEGFTNVTVLSHAVDVMDHPPALSRRSTLLFVGAFAPGSPNEDAARYLVSAILPALRVMEEFRDLPVVVAGAGLPAWLRALDSSVSWQSDVEDLGPLYERARVFVAPTRFSAGIPIKVIEAAAHGVPVVCTPALVSQLGWRPGEEIQAAQDARDFAWRLAELLKDDEKWCRQREAALRRVTADYNALRFGNQLEEVLGRFGARALSRSADPG
jgi:GT2 family glycosyltransferase